MTRCSDNGATRPRSRAISRDATARPSTAVFISMFWQTDETTAHPVDLMKRIYRHQRHCYDFTRKYYLLGRDPLIAGSDTHDSHPTTEDASGARLHLNI